MAVRVSKSVFLRVNRNAPNNESWKIPIMGELLAGEIICLATSARYVNSAALS